jgi:small subunit ribosomal protein S25e
LIRNSSKRYYSSFIRGIFFSQIMGGGKKPTAAKKDRSTNTKDSKKKKGEGGPRKAEIVVLVNEQQAIKIIQNSKVITVQDLARQTGIKVSAANAFLRESVNKGIVKRVGGYSGHHLYQPVSS